MSDVQFDQLRNLKALEVPAIRHDYFGSRSVLSLKNGVHSLFKFIQDLLTTNFLLWS